MEGRKIYLPEPLGICFVVGQDGNSRTTVREGNPSMILAETKEKRAVLPTEKAKCQQRLHLNLFGYHTSGLGFNSFPAKFNDDKTMKPWSFGRKGAHTSSGNVEGDRTDGGWMLFLLAT